MVLGRRSPRMGGGFFVPHCAGVFFFISLVLIYQSLLTAIKAAAPRVLGGGFFAIFGRNLTPPHLCNQDMSN